MFTVVLALTQIPTFTHVCIRVRLNNCVFSNTAPLVYGIDASVKICVSNNIDNNTTTSAYIYISALVLVTLIFIRLLHFFGNIDVGTNICIHISI